MHRQEQDFGENLRLPIDERQNSCYNDPTYAQKEGSNMGEQMKKQQISAGLLAHVDAGRGELLSKMNLKSNYHHVLMVNKIFL